MIGSLMHYYFPDLSETVEDARILRTELGNEHDSFTAESAVDYAYYREDLESLNESNWPLKVVLVGDDRCESIWAVERNYAPYFTASRQQ